MAPFLLDANVLIALAWPEHEFHDRVGRWFANHSHQGWATCPFTQAAFVRVLSNPAFSPDALHPDDAVRVLEANLSLPNHRFWPDSISVPDALKALKGSRIGHQQITDSYLVSLASHHHGKLATLDKGIRTWGTEAVVEWVG